jgi:hypothetical protein
VKIIASSGLSENGKLAEVNSSIEGFLPKPYTAQKLLTTLDELLSDE